MSDSPAETPPDLSARALLAQRDYIRFLAGRLMVVTGTQIQAVTLGWQVYQIARQTMDVPQAALMVSLLGAATFTPILLFFLLAGETADRHDRRRILLWTYTVETLTAVVLAVGALSGEEPLWLLLSAAAVFGASRAFFGPANSALVPMLIPRALMPRALAWSSLAFQTGAILGPALAGGLIAISPALAFGVAGLSYVGGWLCVFGLKTNTQPAAQPGSRLDLIKEGLAYVWSNKIVFGSISLDLFAVLLGGARAMLPVFAHDVLKIGASAFGLLAAAPAVGAAAMGVLLAVKPLRRRAGAAMFSTVAIFALATIVFGLSKNLWLSVAAMVVLGASDMISVFVRQTLIQIVTPDNMRGRVSAVSSLFIGASNELGDFESGLVARLIGPVAAVVAGGCGALVVTGLWAWMFPALRKADRLT